MEETLTCVCCGAEVHRDEVYFVGDQPLCRDCADEETFVIGGAQIYAQAMPLADRFYLTRVHHAYEGDTSFPQWDVREWRLISSVHFDRGEKYPYPFDIECYERIR